MIHPATLKALWGLWTRLLPESAGWMHFSPLRVGTLFGPPASKELYMRAIRYATHCPSCLNRIPKMAGRHLVCCGLKITPTYLVREVTITGDDADPIALVTEASRTNARCSGGQVEVDALANAVADSLEDNPDDDP